MKEEKYKLLASTLSRMDPNTIKDKSERKSRKDYLKTTKEGRYQLAKEKYKDKQEKKGFKSRIERIDNIRKSIGKNLDKKLSKKVVSRKVLRSDRATLKIPEYQEDTYRSIYFKNAYEKEKKLFFG